MGRIERRKEIREIKKAIIALQNDPIYINLLHDEDLGKTVKENLVFLEKGEYQDKDIQFKYDKIMDYIQTQNQLAFRFRELTKNSVFLRGDNKKTVTNI